MSDQHQPAGWFPAPDRPGQQRYWDGSQWTEHYAPQAPQAPQGAQALQPQPKKGGAMKVLIPVFACLALALVAVVVVVAVSGGDDEETTSDGPRSTEAGDAAPAEGDEEPAAAGEDTHEVGETGTTGDLEVTVETVEDPWEPTNEFDTPAEGQRYVGVELTIVNTGDETTTFSTFAGAEVVDSEGQAWDVTFTTSDEPSIDGDVPAGATRKGWLYLEVGEDAMDLELRIKGSFTATGTVFLL